MLTRSQINWLRKLDQALHDVLGVLAHVVKMELSQPVSHSPQVQPVPLQK